MTSQNSTYQKLTLCEQLRNDLRYASKSYRKKLAMYNREAAIRLNYEHIRKVKLNLTTQQTSRKLFNGSNYIATPRNGAPWQTKLLYGNM